MAKPGLDSAKGGLSELKSRLLFVFGAIIVFQIRFLHPYSWHRFKRAGSIV